MLHSLILSSGRQTEPCPLGTAMGKSVWIRCGPLRLTDLLCARRAGGLSLEYVYWIREEGGDKTGEEVNLFHNLLSLFVTEISRSGANVHYSDSAEERDNVHTPELTTLDTSVKGWIWQDGKLFLYKTGKFEIYLYRTQMLRTVQNSSSDKDYTS